MKKGIFNKRIPTIAALLVLIVVIGISTFLIQSGIFYVGKAAPDPTPQNFMITNVTDTSFTAIYTTNTLNEGVIKISNTTTGNSLILDDRDKKSGIKKKYASHHITIHNLKANTEYSFSLVSEGKEFTDPKYTVRTGSVIVSSPPAQNPLFGKVLLPDGQNASDTLVTATTKSSQLLSSVTDQKGEFIIPTNSLRNQLFNEYFKLSNDSVFNLEAIKSLMKTQVTSTFLSAQNLPPIALLQKYVFTQSSEEEIPQEPKFTFSVSENSSNSITINTPDQQEVFTDLRPGFSGTAPIGSTVNVVVTGVFTKQVLTSRNGEWSTRNDNNFQPGKYTIKASTKDKDGKSLEVTSQFSILPQGSQILADQLNPTTKITPSPTKKPASTPTVAVVAPTATNTPIPTATPTPLVAASPTTQVVSPTPLPQASPTPLSTTATPTSLPTIKPTIYLTPTNLPPIAKPGAFENSLVLTSVSVLLIAVGIALLFAL